jgi:hypothetical protein
MPGPGVPDLKKSQIFLVKTVFSISAAILNLKKKFFHKTYILVIQTNCIRVFGNSLEFVDLAAKTNFGFFVSFVAILNFQSQLQMAENLQLHNC